MKLSSIEVGGDGDFLKKDSFVAREGLKRKWEQSLYEGERRLQDADCDRRGSNMHIRPDPAETLPSKLASNGVRCAMEVSGMAVSHRVGTSFFHETATDSLVVNGEADARLKMDQARNDVAPCCSPDRQAGVADPLHLIEQGEMSQDLAQNFQDVRIECLEKSERDTVCVNLTDSAEGVSVWIRVADEAKGKKIIADVLMALRLNEWAKDAQVFVNGSLYARYK